MVKQEVAYTKKSGVSDAVNELAGQLGACGSSCQAIMFMASSEYDFIELSAAMKKRYPNVDVMGTTTSGEITYQGFFKGSIVATALYADRMKVKGVLIDNSNALGILSKGAVENAYRECGFKIGARRPEKGFGLLFITGLTNSEETLLSLIYGIIQNPEFKIAGGSAGDDLKMKETAVSLNGKVVNNGAAILFIKTDHRFSVKRERIYRRTNRELILTETNIDERKIVKINGILPIRAYAAEMGVSEAKAREMAFSNPFGRIIGEHVFISSIAGCNDDGSISMFCRVLPGTKVNILTQENIFERQRQTYDSINKEIKKAGFVFLINCILRTVAFEQQNCEAELTRLINGYYPTYCGYSSYGEQENRHNSNQTLIAIVIDEN